jgi:preprotein translocase subunit SecY
MFATIKQIFNPKNRDIQKKILFTFAALFIFKLGTTITVPGVDLDTANLGFLEIVNAMSGGAFEKASIFALGVMPYITASIVIQLLAMDIIPYLSELNKQGGVGRNKLNQITRIT